MPYGTLKADTLTYYTATGDVNLAISGIAISGSPLISGVSGVFTTSVSGATVTGNAGQFTTITGGTAQFTNITGVSGTFTSRISGATVTGTSGQFTTITATTGVFTTSISGATISGDVGLFTTISGSQGVFNSGLSIPSGTAASPSISFNGDPNTGLYSTGADAVAISTNGTGRLFVDSSGRVGIGTASPAVLLSVATAASGEGLRLSNGTNNERLHFYTGANALIESNNSNLAITARDGNNIIFSTTNIERARIDSSGRVGIGTSSPGAGIHISTAGQTTAALDTAGSLNTIISDTGFAAGNGGSLVFGASGGAYRFAAIKGILSDGSNNSVGALAFSTRNATTDATLTERLRIDAAGRVGIGTTAVDVKTQIVKNALTKSWSADGDDVLAIENSGTTNVDFRSGSSSSTYLMFSDGDARARGYVAYLHSSDALLLGAANSERARIDSSGRLLVGTSTHSGLNVSNYTGLNAYFANTGDTGISLSRFQNTTNSPSLQFLKSRGTSVGSLTVVSSGDDLGEIVFAGADGDEFRAGASITAQVDNTPGNNDMPGRLVFSTTADGASSPTERVRISQNGVVTVKNGAVAEIGTLTDGATVTPDFAANCNFTLTISGNRTLANPTNITAGQTGSIFIIQGSGSNTLSWGSYWDFAGGTAPTLSTASGAVDRVDYVVRTSTSIHTVFTANYS